MAWCLLLSTLQLVPATELGADAARVRLGLTNVQRGVDARDRNT